MNIKPLTNIDIIQWCQHYNIPLHGVYMRDELPGRLDLPGFYVVNFDGSTGPGTHWVAIMSTGKGGVCLYFDPLATPVLQSVCDMHQARYFNVFANSHALQSDVSKLCGHWCCAFMYYHNRHDCTTSKGAVDAYYDFTHKVFTRDTRRNEVVLLDRVFNLSS